MYKLLKNAIIKGDRQFLPDLCTSADITEYAVLNNYFYFRGTLWIPNFKPFRTVILLTVGLSAAVAFTKNHSQVVFASWTCTVLN